MDMQNPDDPRDNTPWVDDTDWSDNVWDEDDEDLAEPPLDVTDGIEESDLEPVVDDIDPENNEGDLIDNTDGADGSENIEPAEFQGDVAELEEEAERILDGIESEGGSVPQTPPVVESPLKEKAKADNYLVTQATTTACLGIICEVIDKLGGNGLTLATAEGKVPERSDIRRLVARSLHAVVNENTISFSNAANVGE